MTLEVKSSPEREWIRIGFISLSWRGWGTCVFPNVIKWFLFFLDFVSLQVRNREHVSFIDLQNINVLKRRFKDGVTEYFKELN